MERIILFQVPKKTEEQIRHLASVKKISVVTLDRSQAAGKLSELLEGRANAVLPALEQVPESSLMVFCDVTEKHFDKLLFEMRNKDIKVDYKAALTAANRQWTLLQLMRELERERSQILQK